MGKLWVNTFCSRLVVKPAQKANGSQKFHVDLKHSTSFYFNQIYFISFIWSLIDVNVVKNYLKFLSFIPLSCLLIETGSMNLGY